MRTLALLPVILLVFLILPSCDRNANNPEIADQVFYLDENSQSGTLVGQIEADDLDEQQTLTFEIMEGNTGNAFTLENTTGKLYVNKQEALDFEKIQQFALQISVSDNHPNDPLESTAKVTVILNNLNEFHPEIEEQSYTVEERSNNGAEIGTILATDADSGQVLSFRIESGNSEGALYLDSLTGILYVNDSSWFDYNTNQKLVVMVSVTDNGSDQQFSSYALITVEVTDVVFQTIDISGYVQKGPFVLGSPITISELNPDLVPTGRVFSTQVSDNSGKFSIPNVGLESQYLLLKADGFYFNERTGSLSEAQLTLYSLVDMTDLESFNINVITHLEKERITELMQQGMNMTDAKQQARNEILGVFEFTTVDNMLSEEMDISTSGEDNAMLLAVSLILQGDRTTGAFFELLNQVSSDLKTDGTLDNGSIGSQLINGVHYANLPVIREQIEQRYDGLGTIYEIPDFEKYVEMFMQNTEFVTTNYISYPEYSPYGQNILFDGDFDTVMGKAPFSLAADLPQGANLRIRMSGAGWSYRFLPDGPVNWNVSSYNRDEMYQNFTAINSGESCDLNFSFDHPQTTLDSTTWTYTTTGEHVLIEYFEGLTDTPTRSKTLTIK